MSSYPQDPTFISTSSNGFLVYIVVVILVAIFLTYLTMICIIRPAYFRQRNGRTVSTLDSSHSGAAEMDQLDQSNPFPSSRRHSIDPALLNQFAMQTFHLEMAHKKAATPIAQMPNSEDCHVVDIYPDISLAYPEPAHIVDGDAIGEVIDEVACEATSRATSKATSKVDAANLNRSLNEKPFDAVSLASSSCELCAICLDQYEEGLSKIRTLPCSHYFHTECIDKWLLRENTTTNCPCCNFDVSTVPRTEAPQPTASARRRQSSYKWWLCSTRSTAD